VGDGLTSHILLQYASRCASFVTSILVSSKYRARATCRQSVVDSANSCSYHQKTSSWVKGLTDLKLFVYLLAKSSPRSFSPFLSHLVTASLAVLSTIDRLLPASSRATGQRVPVENSRRTVVEYATRHLYISTVSKM
jgi:hypothetical protein